MSAVSVKPGITSRVSSCRCYAGAPAGHLRPKQQLSSQPAVPATSRCLQPQQQPQQQLRVQRQFSRLVAQAEPEAQGNREVVITREFGYSRKDVLIIIVALIALGVVMYEGLQAMGMDAGIAGNWVQATIFLGICVGWVSTYLWRVANKKMTYAKQLEMYESAVMQKRLEEMTEAELQQLMGEVEADKARLMVQKEAMQRRKQQQQSSTPQ